MILISKNILNDYMPKNLILKEESPGSIIIPFCILLWPFGAF